MATFPFWDVLTQVLAGGGAATLQVNVPDGETRDIDAIRIISTGAFSIVGIRDSRGRTYSDAASGNPALDTFFANATDQFNGYLKFPIPIHLEGNISWMIDVLDTSGAANTVRVVTSSIRNDGS